jgi:hypothetical protein
MHSAVRIATFVSFTVLLLLPLGCGGPHYQLAAVSGHVTMDNKPLANANVAFYPTTGSEQPAAKGRTDEEGNYKLETFARGRDEDGAVVGESRVEISINAQNAGRKIDPGGKGHSRSENGDLVPAKYNSQTILKFTVPPEGTEQADFPLTSK